MSHERKAAYTRIAERAAKGEYELVMPLDALILESLPPEGTMMSGLYLIGETVVSLKEKFPEAPGELLSARLASMKHQGLTIKIRGVGKKSSGKGAWQRTDRASQLLTDWKGSNGTG